MDQAVQQKIDKFFGTYPLKTYPKGQILVFAGEAPDHIYHLVSGRVRKYDVSARGDEVIVNLFKPPAFFPMSWAIAKQPNGFFYKTETVVSLHQVPASDALAFLTSNPDVMLDLLTRIYNGTEGLLGKMVRLMAGSAESRLWYELFIESKRFGERTAEGKTALHITESDLAARTGLTRETVSREMQKLKDQDILHLASRQVVIDNLNELARLVTLPI